MTRNTIQRALVLEAVTRLQNHATADEIYEAISKEHPDISRATVYRNLNRLAEEGQIRKRSIPGSADRYDHLCTDHYHLKCEKCSRIFDLDMDYLPDLDQKIKNSHGFMLKSHDIIFNGVCPDCQRQIP